MAVAEPTGAAGVSHPHLARLVSDARSRGALPVAVAYPCDAASLQAAVAAARAGLIRPVLVGPMQHMRQQASAAGIDLSGCELIESGAEPAAAARTAVALAREGQVRALMKGSLHSDDLLGAAVSREGGLRTGRRASHVFVMDVPGQARPLLYTDCVVNIAPDLIAKRDIAQNAIGLAHGLGITTPKLAILAAVESVNPAMQATLDAAALCKMADRGQITGALLDGPLAFDNAVSALSARHKGIVSEVAGSPDILLVPTLEAGNMIYKQLVYMAGADCAGLVLGMRVPVILTSRADSVQARVASCALAVLGAGAG